MQNQCGKLGVLLGILLFSTVIQADPFDHHWRYRHYHHEEWRHYHHFERRHEEICYQDFWGDRECRWS